MLAKRYNKYKWKLIGLMVSCFALYCLVVYASGSAAVDDDIIENSSSAFNTNIYFWYDDLRDTRVAPSVVEARSRLARADLLVLIGTRASAVNSKIEQMRCRDLLAMGTDVTQMMIEAEQFLRANIDGAQRCVCAPMLGRQYAYMAMANRHNGADAPSEMAHHHEHGDDIDIEHAINPLDQHASEYDALDAAFFDVQGVDLSIENESQDYLFNEPRGNFSVVRRQKVVFTRIDRACEKRKWTVRGTLALCAQQCFDMLRGIDLIERARMQQRAGVKLNDERLQRWDAELAARPLSIVRDEL